MRCNKKISYHFAKIREWRQKLCYVDNSKFRIKTIKHVLHEEMICKIRWKHFDHSHLNCFSKLYQQKNISVMTSFFSSLWTSVIEYETPRLVRIHNRKLGLVRRLIQASIVAYVCLYALWLQRGYQAGWTIILFKQNNFET